MSKVAIPTARFWTLRTPRVHRRAGSIHLAPKDLVYGNNVGQIRGPAMFEVMAMFDGFASVVGSRFRFVWSELHFDRCVVTSTPPAGPFAFTYEACAVIAR